MSARDDRAEAMREACAKEIDRPLNNGESWHIADKIGRTRLGHLSGDEIRAIKVFAEMRAANVRALPLPAAPAPIATPADDAVREARERDAFAKWVVGNDEMGFDSVVWDGGWDPLGVVKEPEFSKHSLRSEWSTWLARALLAAERAQRDAGAVAEGRVGDQRAQGEKGGDSVQHDMETRCPKCGQDYRLHKGDEVECVCPTPSRDGERPIVTGGGLIKFVRDEKGVGK